MRIDERDPVLPGEFGRGWLFSALVHAGDSARESYQPPMPNFEAEIADCARFDLSQRLIAARLQN